MALFLSFGDTLVAYHKLPNRDGFRGGYFSGLQFGKASLCQTQTVGIPASVLFLDAIYVSSGGIYQT